VTESADVLVGVHVHAQPERLKETLASLEAAGGPPFGLVLLPDGPDPETRAALSRLAIPQDPTAAALGPPACFNRLARTSAADVIVLLESGCVAGPGWLDGLLAALRSRPGIGLAGPSTNLAWNAQAAFPDGGGASEAVAAAAADAATRFGARTRSLAPLHGLADFCLAVTRPALDAVGAADEGFGLAPCWEMEYCARALRAGFRSVWACGAYVHRSPFTPRRIRTERTLFETGKRRYQDAVCGLRLSGSRDRHRAHCEGTDCVHFAPAERMRLHLPLTPRSVVSVPATGRTASSLVSCIMPTRNRADFAEHAVDLLIRQDHENWELIVVDDGDDDLRRRLPVDPRVRYLRGPAGESIGAKRNRACAAARGELIVHWDDDDWYAPERLRRQIEPLLIGAADITALRGTTFLDLDWWTYWKPTPELHRRMFVQDVHGGTLAYRRGVWRANRFPATSLAEDAAFLQAAVRRGARLHPLSAEDLFVYVRHGATAWRFACGSFLDPRGWRRVREPDLPEADRRFLADRSAGSPAGRGPLVSCVMPTANRRSMVPRAIAYFQRQDHPSRELVILDDGEDRVADLIPADPRIRYLPSDRPMVLGAKRNAACEEARGEVIVHWDDDDWFAPHRLGYQLRELSRSGADVCGTARQLYLKPATQRAWRYEHPEPHAAGWVAGNTLCYTAAAWRRNPFTAIGAGEDARFLSDRRLRLHVLPESEFVVGIIHDGNASPKRADNAWWHPIPLRQVRDVLGADAAGYLPAV
jgi:glycosyltransferase involved in cell wall biosynthesis